MSRKYHIINTLTQRHYLSNDLKEAKQLYRDEEEAHELILSTDNMPISLYPTTNIYNTTITVIDSRVLSYKNYGTAIELYKNTPQGVVTLIKHMIGSLWFLYIESPEVERLYVHMSSNFNASLQAKTIRLSLARLFDDGDNIDGSLPSVQFSDYDLQDQEAMYWQIKGLLSRLYIKALSSNPEWDITWPTDRDINSFLENYLSKKSYQK